MKKLITALAVLAITLPMIPASSYITPADAQVRDRFAQARAKALARRQTGIPGMVNPSAPRPAPQPSTGFPGYGVDNSNIATQAAEQPSQAPATVGPTE